MRYTTSLHYDNELVLTDDDLWMLFMGEELKDFGLIVRTSRAAFPNGPRQTREELKRARDENARLTAQIAALKTTAPKTGRAVPWDHLTEAEGDQLAARLSTQNDMMRDTLYTHRDIDDVRLATANLQNAASIIENNPVTAGSMAPSVIRERARRLTALADRLERRAR